MNSKIKRSLFYLIVAFVLFSSCGAIKNCDEVGDEFYLYLKTRDYDKLLTLIDEEAFKHTDKAKWVEGLGYKEENFGLPLSVQRVDFETNTQDRVTRVGIKYKVVYGGSELYEKLEFVQRDKEYKITFYQFNSDSTLVY